MDKGQILYCCHGNQANTEKHLHLVGTQKMHFCSYFEKYLFKSLDIWITDGIIGDVQNDIRKVTLVKVKVIQTKVKCSKRAIFP